MILVIHKSATTLQLYPYFVSDSNWKSPMFINMKKRENWIDGSLATAIQTAHTSFGIYCAKFMSVERVPFNIIFQVSSFLRSEMKIIIPDLPDV